MLRRVLLASAALAAALTASTTTAATAVTVADSDPGVSVAATASTVATGFDVSYPQCGRTLPTSGDIAVVGVNAGTGTTTNPCLAEQLAWGDTVTADGTVRRADVYVNTANPGHLGAWWPTADLTRSGVPVTNPAGHCAGAEDAACSYVYGYSVGMLDVSARGVSSVADRTWWLDVETMNSWSWDRGANLAAVEGMAAAIRAAGADVGVYSTPRQWSLIVGDATPSIALSGAPSWIAGATTRAGALANCAVASPTPAGRVRMVQWVEHGIDHDIACGVGVSGTRPTILGQVAVGSRLVASPGAWGPSGIRLQYAWTLDGVAIPTATGPSYTPVLDDAGSRLAVTVTGSRLGVPSLTMTSTTTVVVDPAAEQVSVNAFHALQYGG